MMKTQHGDSIKKVRIWGISGIQKVEIEIPSKNNVIAFVRKNVTVKFFKIGKPGGRIKRRRAVETSNNAIRKGAFGFNFDYNMFKFVSQVYRKFVADGVT